MKTKIILLLISLSSIVLGQDNFIKLSLNDALEKAAKNNYEIKLAQTDVDKMAADLNKSLSVFLPSITLSETYIKSNDPLNAFSFKLRQQIVTQQDFNPALLNNPDDIENFTTKLEVKQPLINADGFFGRAAAADGLSAMRNKLERTKNYITFVIKKSYYGLILAEKSLEVLDKSLKAVEKHYATAKDFFDEGMISKADLLKVQVMLNDIKRRKLDAENNYRTANENLKYMLGIEESGLIQPTDKLELLTVSEIRFDINSVNESRTDMAAMKDRISSLENMSLADKFKFLPRLNAFGSFEYNDSELFGTSAESWMFGLNLQWNLFNGFSNIGQVQKTNAELESAEWEYKKAAEKNKIDIASAMRNVKTLEQAVELAKTAEEQSGESLKIIKDRYEAGMEKTADLLTAESENAKTSLEYINAVYGYNSSVFYLEFLLEQNIGVK